MPTGHGLGHGGFRSHALSKVINGYCCVVTYYLIILTQYKHLDFSLLTIEPDLPPALTLDELFQN